MGGRVQWTGRRPLDQEGLPGRPGRTVAQLQPAQRVREPGGARVGVIGARQGEMECLAAVRRGEGLTGAHRSEVAADLLDLGPEARLLPALWAARWVVQESRH